MPSAPASTLDEDATLALPDERYQGPPVPSPDERPLAFLRLFANGRWAVQSPPELIASPGVTTTRDLLYPVPTRLNGFSLIEAFGVHPGQSVDGIGDLEDTVDRSVALDE